MKKRILCLLLMAVMILGSTLTVHAEDIEGSKDWNVTFNGDALDSNFKSTQLTEDILNIQPGDSITLWVNLKNIDDQKSDWYMTNEVLQSLEDSNSAASGGAYTYILSYFDKAGNETILYSSAVVGGDGTSEGLHQATDNLEDYFYLDRLDSGETGVIQLYVQLDGETQGNDYQNTLARLKMNFAVEKVNDGVVKNSDAVKTGDNSPIVIFSTVALVSGLVLLAAAIVLLKRKNEKKGA